MNELGWIIGYKEYNGIFWGDGNDLCSDYCDSYIIEYIHQNSESYTEEEGYYYL